MTHAESSTGIPDGARIAVIGTGAMGSVYAGLLADAGYEVWAIDTWEAHIAAIRATGLRVSGASGDRRVWVNATTDAREVGKADLVIVATKAADVAAAAEAARGILAPGAAVIAIQNGLGSAERVAEVVGSERVLVGVVGGFGASIPEPGHAHHNGWEFVRLGELSGGMTERLEAVAGPWRAAGFKVLLFPDIERMVWEKLICNVAYSGTCTLSGMTIGEVLAHPEAFAVATACAGEALAVARRLEIAVEVGDVEGYIRRFGEKIPGARPSMLLDHLAGRRSEVDVINGAVPPAAAKAGLVAPVNETVSRLIRAREALFRS